MGTLQIAGTLQVQDWSAAEVPETLNLRHCIGITEVLYGVPRPSLCRIGCADHARLTRRSATAISIWAGINAPCLRLIPGPAPSSRPSKERYRRR